MQTTINYPKLRFGKKLIDVFPYWIGFLLLGVVFGLIGAFVVLRDGLQVTRSFESRSLGTMDLG
ncbi:hypothetical protein [Candidatus Villigracilis saccharophilus]|uniref:hypothetical protein n=1 Tax=Candidatus Villigracilis saccharophilus TaxID=3140684 RepID=UPI003135E38B|nr:hypothetical protein [Anaerolineales bacterium]